jgi:hypothetical protein
MNQETSAEPEVTKELHLPTTVFSGILITLVGLFVYNSMLYYSGIVALLSTAIVGYGLSKMITKTDILYQ